MKKRFNINYFWKCMNILVCFFIFFFFNEVKLVFFICCLKLYVIEIKDKIRYFVMFLLSLFKLMYII